MTLWFHFINHLPEQAKKESDSCSVSLHKVLFYSLCTVGFIQTNDLLSPSDGVFECEEWA